MARSSAAESSLFANDLAATVLGELPRQAQTAICFEVAPQLARVPDRLVRTDLLHPRELFDPFAFARRERCVETFIERLVRRSI